MAQPLDQGRRREHLADARAVNPDQRSRRPHVAGEPAPFGTALGIFLAESQPLPDQRRRERHHR